MSANIITPVRYTPPMPVDVEATVVSNTRLSPDFNVLALSAPAIAAEAKPGQFVMVKTAEGELPLLRRPYSIFEIFRDATGMPTGFSLFSKRVGTGSQRLYDATRGQRLACLGPLGRPFSTVLPPTEAWMVAGGVVGDVEHRSDLRHPAPQADLDAVAEGGGRGGAP